jgi:hypothetical protein
MNMIVSKELTILTLTLCNLNKPNLRVTYPIMDGCDSKEHQDDHFNLSLPILTNISSPILTLKQLTLSWMVATPRNMKMIVSEVLLNIFMAYFNVV